MNPFPCRTACAIAAALALFSSAPETHAAGVASGQYSGTVDLGPVLLDGRYPFTVAGTSPGTIDVSTSVTGALSAKVTFAAVTEDAVGRITVRGSAIRLSFRGKIDGGRIAVNATLEGDAFVGTVSVPGTTMPCRIDMSSVGPLRGTYDLDLACSAKGKVTGTGTLTVARQSIPVTVRGAVRKERLSGTIVGGGTLLRLTRGDVGPTAIRVLHWKAKGFGAAVKAGRPVRLRPQ